MSCTHLQNETSPYLLQHINNPVEWYPWGEAALNRAKTENKPILLSIGYSACHWCHVMAHESFEDQATADLMNALFINIKVDREERPDLDKIYQLAHQFLTQRSGGWPLTVFLSPQTQTPFFAGTYFPKTARHQLPSFSDLLQNIHRFTQEHPDDIERQNKSLHQAFATLDQTTDTSSISLSIMPLDTARQELISQFDAHHGGFGNAPKFPHPTSLERLLRHWKHTSQQNSPDQQALHAAIFTLEKMACGGIFDHLAGGFCRYSTDELWMIPHFEKMLYDNGPLLALYSEAWLITQNDLFLSTAQATADWVIHTMQAETGGFYSSLDADSEGVEGKFYAWQPEQLKTLLGDHYPLFADRFGLNQKANFEGHWHLYIDQSLETLAKKYALSIPEIQQQLQQSSQTVLSKRQQRIAPERDDKILCSWNGLMIKGLAVAGRHCQQPEYILAAERALNFIKQHLWKNGRLLATYKDGKAHLNAYLDDYVFLIDAILELLQCRWKTDDLNFAIELTETVIAHFSDHDGGFYFTANDHEALIHRPKTWHDEATPSGNGITALVLNRLGHLLGNTQYTDIAEQTLKANWQTITQSASAFCSSLNALEEILYPPQLIILRGEMTELPLWQSICQQSYHPRQMCFAIATDDQPLPGLLNERKAQSQTVAYICSGTSCQLPITNLDELKLRLSPSD